MASTSRGRARALPLDVAAIDGQGLLPFTQEAAPVPEIQPALWTPREIWVKITCATMATFHEDRRVDYKRAESKIDFDDFAKYLSAFSNTPDGGVIVFGADSHGKPTGCSRLQPRSLNFIQRCHTSKCPMAKPEFRRFETVVSGAADFCEAVFVPYIGKLVETNKGQAWIRYGDSLHEMSEEEKRDFKSANHERAFELDAAPCNYPEDFEANIISDLCSRYRQAEARTNWTNEEILIDSHLAEKRDGKFIPFMNLMLIAGKDPRVAIPGCRIRVQRFLGIEEGAGSTWAPVVDQWANGNIVQIISKTEEIIEQTMFDVRWFGTDARFAMKKEYPRSAWFEAVVNACVHRSYSFSGSEVTVKFFADRLVIESPGGFFPPVNEHNIYESRASRNYHLMEGLSRLGYVQMAREGTRRIRTSMADWGLPG